MSDKVTILANTVDAAIYNILLNAETYSAWAIAHWY